MSDNWYAGISRLDDSSPWTVKTWNALTFSNSPEFHDYVVLVGWCDTELEALKALLAQLEEMMDQVVERLRAIQADVRKGDIREIRDGERYLVHDIINDFAICLLLYDDLKPRPGVSPILTPVNVAGRDNLVKRLP